MGNVFAFSLCRIYTRNIHWLFLITLGAVFISVATRYGCESSICAYSNFIVPAVLTHSYYCYLVSHVPLQHDRDQLCRDDGTSANISLTAVCSCILFIFMVCRSP
jgi:hypothetical protein